MRVHAKKAHIADVPRGAKNHKGEGVVTYAYNPSMQEAGRKIMSSRLAWNTE